MVGDCLLLVTLCHEVISLGAKQIMLKKGKKMMVSSVGAKQLVEGNEMLVTVGHEVSSLGAI